jgi:hypothetical protein
MAQGETIKQFLVGVGFDVDESSMKKFSKGMAVATAGVVAVGAAVVATGALVTKFVTAVAKDLDKLSDNAIRLNTTAEELDRLGFAASQLDSNVEAATTAFSNMARQAGEAFMGMGRGKLLFEEIGLVVTDANGELKNTEVLLSELGGLLKGMSGGQRIATLEKLGISSTMIRTLTEDLSGINKTYDDIRKASGVSLNQAARDASDYMDAMGTLEKVFESLKIALVSKLMPEIKKAMEGLTKNVLEKLPKIVDKLEPILSKTLKWAKYIAELGITAFEVVGNFVGWLADLDRESGGWLKTIGLIIAAWKLLSITMLLSPVGAVLALAGALLVLYDDYKKFQDGTADGLIDWEKWLPVVELATTAINFLGDSLEYAARGIGNFLTNWAKLMSLDFAGIDINPKLLDPLGFGGTNPAFNNFDGGASSQNINANTTIQVVGVGQPGAVATLVEKYQGRVYKDLAAHLAGKTR